MANTRGKNGTRLCRTFHNVTVQGECWLRKSEVDISRQVLHWNLWHTADPWTLVGTCANSRHCVNPRHTKRGIRKPKFLFPYDHPQILNRWALLLWFAAGHTDYELVTLDNALQLLQQEVA